MKWGTGCHDLSFSILSLKPVFSLSSFTFIKRLLYFLFGFSTLEWYHYTDLIDCEAEKPRCQPCFRKTKYKKSITMGRPCA